MASDNTTYALLKSIRNTVELLLSGYISEETAAKDYDKFLKKYNEELCSEKVSPDNNFLKSLLYQHNINNYSKFTALFSLSHNSAHVFEYSGDDSLLEITKEKLTSLYTSFSTGETVRTKLQKKENRDLDLIAKQIYLSENTIIVTLKSSNYFEEKKFDFLHSIIERIFNTGFRRNNPVSIDYFEMVSADIEKYIKQYTVLNENIHSYFFTFTDIKNITGSTNINIFTELADKIQTKLKASFHESAKIIYIANNHYLILLPEKHDKEIELLTFTHQGITLHYDFEMQAIDISDNLYKFWEYLFRKSE